MRERLVRRRVLLCRLVPIQGPFASRAGICSSVGAIPLEGRLLIWSEGVTLRTGEKTGERQLSSPENARKVKTDPHAAVTPQIRHDGKAAVAGRADKGCAGCRVSACESRLETEGSNRRLTFLAGVRELQAHKWSTEMLPTKRRPGEARTMCVAKALGRANFCSHSEQWYLRDAASLGSLRLRLLG